MARNEITFQVNLKKDTNSASRTDFFNDNEFFR